MSPGAGSSTGEWDSLTVSLDTTNIWLGNFQGQITISDPNAENNPQTVTVTLEVRKPPFPYPPQNVALGLIDNEGLFIKQYINRLTWEGNPKNNDIFTIVKYRVYRKLKVHSDEGYVLFAEVEVSSAWVIHDSFSVKADRDKYTYAVSIVNSEGQESLKTGVF